jgi:hypothetical protein
MDGTRFTKLELGLKCLLLVLLEEVLGLKQLEKKEPMDSLLPLAEQSQPQAVTAYTLLLQ